MNIRRRLVIALGTSAIASPLGVMAQQPTKVWRIGYLGDGTAASRAVDLREFRASLEELGYVHGRNITIEPRWTEGRKELRAALANELVRLKVDVIVTHGVPAALAAKAATSTIPIVVAVAVDFIR
jgi:putative ABC transport system substrate-binding protein